MTVQTIPLRHAAQVLVSNVDKKTADGDPRVRLVNYTDVYYHSAITPNMPLMEATATAEQVRTFRVLPGDSIITKDSETADDIGVPAYIEDATPDMVCGYHLAMLRPGRALHPKFLFWALASDQTREQFAIAANGLTRYGLTYGAIQSAGIPVPPVEEQRRIADFLDAQTTRIDQIVAARHSQHEALRWVLVAARHEAWAHLQQLNGLVPLRRLVQCMDGARVPLNSEQRSSMVGPYPYWGAGSIVDRIDKYLFDEPLVLLGEDGAPFFDPLRDVSFVVRERVWVNNHIHVLRPVQGADPEFLSHMLNSVDYASYITGSTRDKLTQAQMSSIAVPLAEPVTQVEAARQLDAAADACGTGQRELERSITLLQEFKRSLISAAVSGEFDVSAASGRGVPV